ncbi:MAG: alpha/beta hydrolase [Verrucomicrobia bacterium]|nr:alpha/beta hydrolase [Verrucomicrobiota bacterium]
MKLLPSLLLAFTVAVAPLFAAEAKAPVGEARTYKKIGDRELKLYVLRPDGWKATDRRPAIVFFHGGGWTGGAPSQFNEQSTYFASRGLVCVQVQYRLLASASKAPPDDCIHDARSAMRWVRSHAAELGIAPSRIAAAGGSAGGHLAAHVGLVAGVDDPADDRAVSPKPNALLLFNPVLDNGPGEWGAARVGNRFPELSPAHNVSRDDPPAVVFLGTQDKLIPVATMERFKAAMTQAGVRCELHLYEGQGHGFFNAKGADGGKYYALTVRAADQFLASLGWLKGAPTLPEPAPTTP